MQLPFSDYKLKREQLTLEGLRIANDFLERAKKYFGHCEFEAEEFSGEDGDHFQFRTEMVGNVFIDDIYRKVKYEDLVFAVKDIFQKMNQSGESVEDVFYSSNYKGLADCDAAELIIKTHKESKVSLEELTMIFVTVAGQIPQEEIGRAHV